MIKKESVLSFFFFSGSKSLVFFTPLAILWLLGDDYYVLVEQKFATSLLLWPVLALGMTSAYSYFFLEQNDHKFVQFYYRYLLIILCFISLLCLGVYFGESRSYENVYTPFIIFLMCFSYFVSTTYKCNSDVVRSSSFDALPYVFFFLFLVISVWNNGFGFVFMMLILLLMLFYTFLLPRKLIAQQDDISQTSMNLKDLNSFTSQDIKHYLSKGLHSFIVSWIAIAVVMFPRVFMADFATLDESKELYLALRFGTFFVLIYQFIQIKMYVKVFKISTGNMKKILLLYWLIVCSILAVLTLLEFSLSYYFAILYTAMWIMVSMLELQVVRRGVQMAVVRGVLLLSPAIAVLFFIEGFYLFIVFSIVLLSLYLFVQAYSVYKMQFSLQIMAIPVMASIGLLYYV